MDPFEQEPSTLTLRFLDFDYSEDTEEIGTFDAMATTGPQQTAAVRAEIVRVLGWAHANFPSGRGKIDEGGEWDYDLQGLQEIISPEAMVFDASAHRLDVRTGPAGEPRHTVTLSISGTRSFCEAFRQRFALW